MISRPEAVMCPEARHVQNHYNKLPDWWLRPDYIVERKAFVKRNPKCDRCGRKATTPGHSPEDYHSYETYKEAVRSDKCESLCNGCNLMERQDFKPCPGCVDKYHQGIIKKIRYIPSSKEMCTTCENWGKEA